MLKSWVVIETVLASRPSAAIAAKISHSLPKPHEPMRLPSKSATDSMPSPAHDTCSVPDFWKTCAMSVSSTPVASSVPSTFGTHAIAKSTSPATSASCGTMSPPEGMISTASKPSSSK